MVNHSVRERSARAGIFGLNGKVRPTLPGRAEWPQPPLVVVQSAELSSLAGFLTQGAVEELGESVEVARRFRLIVAQIG